MNYSELFDRNMGILSAEEQKRLKGSHILIVGCGGIGGTVALALARTGIETFSLVEFDDYTPTNSNRQIACFQSTMGRNKAAVIKEQILDINPAARVSVHDRRLEHAELEPLIAQADIVFPAADDFAFSIILFNLCQKYGKPGLLVLPAGSWAAVSIIRPGSPYIGLIGGAPKIDDYAELHALLNSRQNRMGLRFYHSGGHWQIDYFSRYVEGEVAPAQLCPMVWSSSSIGAMEVVKELTGRWQSTVFPRYWDIQAEKIKIDHAFGLNHLTPVRIGNRIMYRLQTGIFRKPAAWLIEAWWALYRRG